MTAEEKEFYDYKRYYSQEDLDFMYSHFRENVIEDIISNLPLYMSVPTFAKKINNTLRYYNLTIDQLPDYFRRKQDYLSPIKTIEELNKQFERCEKLIYGNDSVDINKPIVIKFDYQFKQRNDLFSYPTFYSFYNKYLETQYGKGTYVIAFPMSIVFLTDDELVVALKHEFGHIKQGHCEIPPSNNFEKEHLNCACDISINIGMSIEEQDLLISVANKIFMGGFPVISLPMPEGAGGYNIPVPTAVGDYKLPLSIIKRYVENKRNRQDDGGNDGGNDGGDGGDGGGDGGGNGGDNKQIEKIKVGDYVVIRGTDPKVYGRVTSVDEINNSYEIEEVDYSQIQVEADLYGGGKSGGGQYAE